MDGKLGYALESERMVVLRVAVSEMVGLAVRCGVEDIFFPVCHMVVEGLWNRYSHLGRPKKKDRARVGVIYETRHAWFQFQAAIEVGTLLDPPAFALPSAFARVKVPATINTLVIVFSVCYRMQERIIH